MSLLMDALRKAEEAKKKAAQESKSENIAPVTVKKQQESGAAKDESIDILAPEMELSMAEIEEVSPRSVVPNIETTVEFEDEDEEDYVLPTSASTGAESAADATPSLAAAQEAKIEIEDKTPQVETEEPESLVAKKEKGEDTASTPVLSQESPQAGQIPISSIARQTTELDDLEEVDSSAADSNQDSREKIVVGEARAEPQTSRTTENVSRRTYGIREGRDEPGRTTARNVFAAKRSPLLGNQNIKTAVSGSLAVVMIVIAVYSYTSFNNEPTFNIPAGSYTATEFVDNGIPLSESETELSIDVVTLTEVNETATDDSRGNSIVEQLAADEEVSAIIGDPSAAPVAVIGEPSRDAANLQPESITQQPSQPAAIVADSVTADDDIGITSIEPTFIEESNLPVVSIEAESTSLAEPTSLISFRRQESVAAVDPTLDRAYAAYQRGSLEQAEELYRQTLVGDPTQRDALIGLANIEARNGNSTEALDLYSRLLARNPSDPIARAGLMDMLPVGSPSEQEAELKRLLDEFPDVAALSYAYGNFLASNQRWNEAQQAYFRALQLAKTDAALSGLVNPDYAFNLAVSLEHLNQREPAQNYYREAIGFSSNHPAGFDLDAVRSRLANLAGNGNNE